MISTLAIRYPDDKDVVELYAQHLINAGELEQALTLYKLHLADRPPQLDYYRAVIDIETYRKRLDSVYLYIDRALEVSLEIPSCMPARDTPRGIPESCRNRSAAIKSPQIC